VTGISRGDQVYLDQMHEVRERILRRLSARGLKDASVVLALEQTKEVFQRKLLVSVDPGDQSLFKKVVLKGFLSRDLSVFRDLLERTEYVRAFTEKMDVSSDLVDRPEEYLLSHIRRLRDADNGQPVEYVIEFPNDQILLSEALNDWGQRMRRAGYFDFKIETKSVEESAGPTLYIDLFRGLRYNIQFRGNINFWERSLREKVLDRPMRLNLPFSESEALAIIRGMYLSEGFKDIEIDIQKESFKDERRLTFVIREGRRHFLGGISWDGVSENEKRVLDDIVRRWRGELSSPFHHIYYDERKIKSQLPQLLDMIRSEGYLQARFLGLRIQAREAGNRVPIEIPVQLGPRFVLRNIVVAGQHPLSKEIIDQVVNMQPGDLARADRILKMASDLKKEMHRRSYIFASVTERLDEIVTYSDVSDEVDLSYTVEAGPRVKVGQIVVDGLRKTREEVILREFRRQDMESGDDWKPESLEQIEQRLQSYGLFGNLRFEMLNGRILERAEDNVNGVEVQERDLKVSLTERPGGAIEFGPGYRTGLGLVAFGEYNYRNLSGMNRSVVLRAQVSRKIENYQFPERKFSFSFLEPYVLGIPFSFRFSAAYEKRDQYIYDNLNKALDGSFKAEEVSTSFILGKDFGKHVSLRHNLYSFSRPRIFDLLGQGGSETQKYRIATMGPTLTFDYRDNIFNPSQGLLFSSSIEYASPDLGSSSTVSYVLIKSEFSFYLPLRKDFVFANSLSYSHMRTLDNVESLPLDRRLTLGGRSSIRSLEEKKLNFFDESATKLMSSYLLRSEIRQHLFSGLGLAYFFDMGRVDARGSAGEGWREAVGVGMRYLTPVGPLSLDFAFNTDQRPNEDFSRILFSVGVF
jgi:outer membrane protein insertion porin family